MVRKEVKEPVLQETAEEVIHLRKVPEEVQVPVRTNPEEAVAEDRVIAQVEVHLQAAVLQAAVHPEAAAVLAAAEANRRAVVPVLVLQVEDNYSSPIIFDTGCLKIRHPISLIQSNFI